MSAAAVILKRLGISGTVYLQQCPVISMITQLDAAGLKFSLQRKYFNA
jgi:hypothetical protein